MGKLGYMIFRSTVSKLRQVKYFKVNPCKFFGLVPLNFFLSIKMELSENMTEEYVWKITELSSNQDKELLVQISANSTNNLFSETKWGK